MAINPNIALSGQTPQIGEGILKLAAIKQQKEDREVQKQQREKKSELTDLQIQQARQQIQKAGKQQSMEDAAIDAVRTKNLLEEDPTQAREFLLDRLNKLNERRKNDPSVNTQHTERLLAAVEQNPEQAKSLLDREIQTMQQLGFIEKPEQQETFEEVKDDQGNIVGQRSSLTGKVVSDPRAKQEAGQVQTLGTQEKEQLGLPEEAVVQKSPEGKLNIVFEPEGNQDQRDRKIQNLVQQGIPQNEAANIVDGVTDIEIVPETGQARLINRSDNSVREIPISSEQEQPRADVPENQTLSGLVDDATGIRSAALAATARVPGTQVSESEQRVLNARNQFRTFENEVARGLVNNPRFPVAERNAVLEAIDISPAIFDTPSALRVRLRSTRNFLQTKMEQAERDANDPNQPEELRSDQAQNAAVLRNAIDRIGDPQSNVDEDIANLGREEARTLVQDMTEEELDALSESERNALADKLR